MGTGLETNFEQVKRNSAWKDLPGFLDHRPTGLSPSVPKVPGDAENPAPLLGVLTFSEGKDEVSFSILNGTQN